MVSPPHILVTGAGGLVGQAVLRRAEKHALAVSGRSRDALDIATSDIDPSTLHGIDAIVNLAAYTQVDRAETKPDLVAVSAKEFPRLACRPANSALDCRRIQEAFGIDALPWRESLSRVLRNDL